MISSLKRDFKAVQVMNDALKWKQNHLGAPAFVLSNTDSQSHCAVILSWAGSPWWHERAIEKFIALGWQKSRRNGMRRNRSSFASSLNGRTFKQKTPPVKVIKCLKKALDYWKDLMVGSTGNKMKHTVLIKLRYQGQSMYFPATCCFLHKHVV